MTTIRNPASVLVPWRWRTICAVALLLSRGRGLRRRRVGGDEVRTSVPGRLPRTSWRLRAA